MNIADAPELDYEKILRETDKSWQIRFSPANVEWIPKSQARMLGKSLYVAAWLIEEKGLTQFIIR
jgi:hypothetical protein